MEDMVKFDHDCYNFLECSWEFENQNEMEPQDEEKEPSKEVTRTIASFTQKLPIS